MRVAMLIPILLLAACAAIPPSPGTTHEATMIEPTRPMIIAHRGASAVLPEHTLAAYARAIDDGADAIEPDLVITRDGVLVARHENEIGGTTDVAAHAAFAPRRTRKRIDGKWVEGWFTEDFTLVELKTLRARQPLPTLRSIAHDGRFEVATLDEIIALAADASARLGRDIVLVPEIKHPSYSSAIGLPMEQRLLDALAAHPYTRRAPVIIQSFETGNLRALRERIGGMPNVRLLQLLGNPRSRPHDLSATSPTSYASMMRPKGLREIATYADIIGPPLAVLQLRQDADGRFRSRLVDDAHAAGLQVMPYTFRPENAFLPPEYRDGESPLRNDAGSIRHIRTHASAGIDGFFADDPAVARRALDGD